MSITTSAIPIPVHPNYSTNARRCRNGQMPCVVCGKGIVRERQRFMVHVHGGGYELVTEQEAYRRSLNGEESSDLYFYPIGADCLRRHPELRPFVTIVTDNEPDGVTAVPGFGQVQL